MLRNLPINFNSKIGALSHSLIRLCTKVFAVQLFFSGPVEIEHILVSGFSALTKAIL